MSLRIRVDLARAVHERAEEHHLLFSSQTRAVGKHLGWAYNENLS